MSKQNIPKLSNDRLSMESIILQENGQGRNKIKLPTPKKGKNIKLQINKSPSNIKIDPKTPSMLKLDNSLQQIERKHRISIFKKT